METLKELFETIYDIVYKIIAFVVVALMMIAPFALLKWMLVGFGD